MKRRYMGSSRVRQRRNRLLLLLSAAIVSSCVLVTQAQAGSSALPTCPESEYAHSIVPSPFFEQDRTVYFHPISGSYESKLWRSTNDGSSWQAVFQSLGPGGFDTPAFVPLMNRSGLTVYLSYSFDNGGIAWSGVVRSTDSGDTWEDRSACDTYHGHSYPSDCIGPYATNQPNTIFAARFNDPQRLGKGVVRSDDGGLTWQVMWEEGSVLEVHPSPAFRDDQVVFARPGGWYEPGPYALIASSDGGITWQRRDAGLNGETVELVFSPGFASDHTLFVAESHTLFRSQDVGLNWQPIARIEGGFGIRDLDISPDYVNDLTLFLSIENALLVSYDDGTNWYAIVDVHQPTLDVRRQLRSFTEQPTNRRAPISVPTPGPASQNYLYLPLAGTIGVHPRPLSLFLSREFDRFYRSDDGGLTWRCLLPP